MRELTITEYNGTRVLTTQRLAECYGTTTDTITKNFNRNRDKYVEGKHFICLKGEELKEFKANGQIDFLPNVHMLYLWTEKGTFLHAKSLNTDIAWEVYDRLIETYFTVKKELIDKKQLSPQLQLMNMLVENMNRTELEQKRQAEQISRVEQTVGNIKDIYTAYRRLES